jgi:hypothetical protein
MKNILTKKILLTIAAATFLLIPGASAALDEPLSGDDGLASKDRVDPGHAVGDAFGIKEFVVCMGQIPLVISIIIVGDINQCTSIAATEAEEFVVCMGQIPLVISVIIVGDINQCTAAWFSPTAPIPSPSFLEE